MIRILLVVLFFTSTYSQAQNFKDLVFAGYQGWFRTNGDIGIGWHHWAGDTVPSAGRVSFEIYPDVREYPSNVLYSTDLAPLGNGAPARLFSSNRDEVVNLHFKWMKEYNIDGVALQRFLVEAHDNPIFRANRNSHAQKVRKGAERYGKHFYITYDLSGMRSGQVVQAFKQDFENELEGELKIFESESYARQDGRAVIGVWGLGYLDRDITAQNAMEIINWLKDKGYYVMGGVPANWRDGRHVRPGFMNVYRQLNMLQPWLVGHFSTDTDIKNYYNREVKADLNLVRGWKVDYQVVIWPGFAWSNWNGGARNMIPRRGGNHLWKQAYWARSLRVSAMVAMFDEYDEGTAIAKAAEDASMIPRDQYFLTMDADGVKLSSDFYLRLTGKATSMLKGTMRQTPNVPIPPR